MMCPMLVDISLGEKTALMMNFLKVMKIKPLSLHKKLKNIIFKVSWTILLI